MVLVCDRCTDSSAIIADSYSLAFSAIGCTLHVIDTKDSSLKGFGAGRTRDVGVQYAKRHDLSGPYIFSDGDCVPSPELVAHHKEQLTVNHPRITCGLRYETVPSSETAAFPVLAHTLLGMPVQDDLRLNAAWCKHLVFGSGFDRLVLNPQVFERSWICWSCNLGMNDEAIDVCYNANGILDGDENRIFNSAFDGRWGGEDGFVGLTMFRMGHEVVALHRRSHVTHIWHPRAHTNQEHLILVARKDAVLVARCVDATLNADATTLTGLRRLESGGFDLGFLEMATVIEPNRLLGEVASLYKEPFVAEAIMLLLAGTVRYKGGLPLLKYEGDRNVLGDKCYWARSMMPWINVAVNGYDLSQGMSLVPYIGNKK
jgi:hypothetical protein